MKRLQKTAIRLVGPVILVLLLLRIGDPRTILDSLAGVDVRPLALAVLLNLVNTDLKIRRWIALLRRRGVEYPVKRAWTSYFSAIYVGMLTPGRVGAYTTRRFPSNPING